MLKIIHIIPSLQKGGAERLVLDIFNESQNRVQVKVKLVVLHPENEYEFLSKNIDIEYCNSKVIPSISGKSTVDISDFERIVVDFKPDIIHSHLFEAEIVSRWKPLQGIKYFTHCHDNIKQFRRFNISALCNKELLTNYFERRMIMSRYVNCDNKFIAISKDTESYLKRSLPKPLKKSVFLVHNAIDYDRFYFQREQVSLSKEIYNFVNIGSLVDKKNQLFLVDVIKILIHNGVNCHLDILGDGINRGIIKQRIFQLGLEKNIVIQGNVNNVEEYLRNSFLYLHAAIYEPFGLVLLEAMSAGLPVICLDGKGNRDVIVEGKNGFMIMEPNPELFAEKILTLINNTKLYSDISQYANEFAKRYDIKAYVDKLLEIYNYS